MNLVADKIHLFSAKKKYVAKNIYELKNYEKFIITLSL